MKTFAEVRMRACDTNIKVPITSTDKPEIMASMINKWQNIINLIASILDVPAGLIMRITQEHMEVFLKSENKENPYVKGGSDQLGHGLYCETVIGKDDELLIENAMAHLKWDKNPDIKLKMISYYGLPLKWPDGEFYGTICVLDTKENEYNDQHKELMKMFRNAIESDLEVLLLQNKLHYLAEVDELTGVCNRRKCEAVLEDEYDRCVRSKNTFSVAMIDLDKFKHINDTYGHTKGDQVLQMFASSISKRIRKIDTIGRWGGDEFIMICPSTSDKGLKHLLHSIKEDVVRDMKTIAKEADFSFGIAEFRNSDRDHEEILNRADKKMYDNKSSK